MPMPPANSSVCAASRRSGKWLRGRPISITWSDRRAKPAVHRRRPAARLRIEQHAEAVAHAVWPGRRLSEYWRSSSPLTRTSTWAPGSKGGSGVPSAALRARWRRCPAPPGGRDATTHLTASRVGPGLRFTVSGMVRAAARRVGLHHHRQRGVGADGVVHRHHRLAIQRDRPHPARQRLQQAHDLQPRQVHAHAHVHARAEAEVVVHVARHVEAVGVGELALVAVGRGVHHHHARTLRDRHAGDLAVFGHEAGEGADRRGQAHHLFDRVRDQLGPRAHQGPLVGRIGEEADRLAGGRDGGVQARVDVVAHQLRAGLEGNAALGADLEDALRPAARLQLLGRAVLVEEGLQVAQVVEGGLGAFVLGSEQVEGGRGPGQHLLARPSIGQADQLGHDGHRQVLREVADRVEAAAPRQIGHQLCRRRGGCAARWPPAPRAAAARR
jgi:hypothetical protein